MRFWREGGGAGQAWPLTASSRSTFFLFLLLRFAVDLAHVELVVWSSEGVPTMIDQSCQFYSLFLVVYIPLSDDIL